MEMVIRPILAQARELLTRVLQPGDVAIDATVGNGHDTLFLAERVGTAGRVYGYDIQSAALERAREQLAKAGAEEQTSLFLQSHAELSRSIPPEHHGRVKAVTFNLGYLPGSDKSVVTLTESTLVALHTALQMLAPGGLMTVALYSGHEEGKEETHAVLRWAQTLEQRDVHVLQYRFLNQKNDPPMLLVFEKRAGK